MAEPQEPVNFSSAMDFIKELQERRPGLWPQFLTHLTEYRTQAPRDLNTFYTKVEELLKDESELLAWFEEFFPKEELDVKAKAETETKNQQEK